VDRRNTPGSIAETLRVPVINYAQPRISRPGQAQARRARTPVRPLAVVLGPDERERQEPLAHPRLVRRSQPKLALVPAPGHVFDDEPTGER
jgi:hypothetical protein